MQRQLRDFQAAGSPRLLQEFELDGGIVTRLTGRQLWRVRAT
jgi:hypothetical protein